MATIVKAADRKKTKVQLRKKLKSFSVQDKYPQKAIDELYGIWEGRDISIEQIREKNTCCTQPIIDIS